MRKFFFVCLLMVFHCGLIVADNYEYVDLGLTSKTLWATCNVGASVPEEYGNFYAWGETQTKKSFTWATYTHCGGTEATAYDIGTDIVGSSYDVATAEMGAEWCLPSLEQFEELVKECTFDLRSLNGVVGFKVDGPNGNYIFLPLCGCKYDSSYAYNTTRGYYWSGTSDVVNNKISQASMLSLIRSPRGASTSTVRRRTGLPVRAVRRIETIEEPEDPVPPTTETTGEFVDLGLSVKWASCNLGATKESELGDLFAWGETTTKSNFTWSNYVYANGTASTVVNIGSDISGTQYDAAFAQWGNDWRMPTEEEFKELLEKCTFVTTTIDGVKGSKVTGPNGNTIFLPYVGSMYDGSTVGKGSNARYWTSTLTTNKQRAAAFAITSGKASMSDGYRRTGFSVRAVSGEKGTVEPVIPSDPIVEPEPPTETSTNEAVDLGLSVKWASWNVGATKASELGNLYAWGETTTKSNFTWSNYVHANGTASTVVNIGSDISGTQYDAALAQWGDDWRMPTEEEFKELLEKCTFVTTTIDGVKGSKVTGPNGNTIFLPYVGSMYDGSTVGKGSNARYWTSTLTTNKQRAAAFAITSDKASMSDGYRRTGFSIRAVCGMKDPEDPEEPSDPIVEPEPPTETWSSEAVDLGLSVKWASCNFGAEEETELGEMYAWGETTTKSNYTWANYIYANGTAASVQNIGSDISDTEYDPVAASLSSNGDDRWRMPTGAELQELKSKCTFKETTISGVKGVTVKGPNGNTIFLPYGGYMYDGKITGKGTTGYYWSSTVSSTSSKAYCLKITGAVATYTTLYRRSGVFIRPVCGEGDIVDPTPYDGPGPGPILPDPYFSNQSLFETDGIETVGASSPSNTDIYTLSGVKVDADNLKPGVYVRNGKKFVVR